MIAVLLSPSVPHMTGIELPKGPVALLLWMVPLVLSTNVSSVPSPPSATGIIRLFISGNILRAPCLIASATLIADILPL